jgi:hypothetical protein
MRLAFAAGTAASTAIASVTVIVLARIAPPFLVSDRVCITVRMGG